MGKVGQGMMAAEQASWECLMHSQTVWWTTRHAMAKHLQQAHDEVFEMVFLGGNRASTQA